MKLWPILDPKPRLLNAEAWVESQAFASVQNIVRKKKQSSSYAQGLSKDLERHASCGLSNVAQKVLR